MRGLPFIGVLLVLGCAHGGPAERTYIVSSEPSYYSPVVRLAIAVDTTADSVLVRIDSGTIRAQGMSAKANVAMRKLTLEGIIARRPDRTSSAATIVEPWSPLTVSKPTELVDSLLFSTSMALRPMTLSIARPRDTNLRQVWLVFRIRGDAMTDEVHMADGRIVPASVRQGGIRVFACSERNLAGTLDKARAKRLATEYASVC